MSRRDLETPHPTPDTHRHYPAQSSVSGKETSFADVYFHNNQWKEGLNMILEELRDKPSTEEIFLKIQQGLTKMAQNGANEKTIFDLLERVSQFYPPAKIIFLKDEILHILKEQTEQIISQMRGEFSSQITKQLPH